MIVTESDAPSIAIAYAANRCNDIAARTDGRTYVELLTLLCYLTLVIARRGAARFTQMWTKAQRPAGASRGQDAVTHA